jgi:hypothetical protein
MAQNAFQHEGANAGRQTRYAPLWNARYFTGLYTNRSIFSDGASRIEGLYLGPRGDVLTAESLNTEVSTRLTLIRRPGSSIFNSNVWDAPNCFYGFRRFSTVSESISLMVDQADGLYDGSNGGKVEIFSKPAGAGQSYMQSVGNTLYWGDGVDQEKWLVPGVWQASTNIQPGTLINEGTEPGVIYEALGGIALPIIGSQIGPAHTTFYANPADIPSQFSDLNGVNVTFSGLTHATFFNGLTLPVIVISSTLGIFQAFHFTGGPGEAVQPETGSGTTGNGTTGATIPTFTATRLAVTADAGQQWKSYGPAVQNWGLVAPTTAPTVSTVGATVTASFWASNATFAAGTSILDSNQNVEYTAAGGISGLTYPTWPAVGTTTYTTTLDGGITWMNLGQAGSWQSATAYGGTPSVTNVILDSNGNWEYATTSGTSGGSPPTWPTILGHTVADNTVTWTMIGPGTVKTTASLGWAYSYRAIDGSVSEASPTTYIIGPIVGGPVGKASPPAYLTVVGAVSTDPQIDQIWIWRTQQGGATLYYEDSIPIDNWVGTFTYYESIIPDVASTGAGALNILIEAPIDGSCDPPPAGLVNLTYHLSRIFGSVENTVYWASGPDVTTGNGLTGFSPENVAVFPSQVRRMVALSTGMLVFTASDVYLMYGNATTSSPLTPYPYALGYGLGNFNALDTTGGVVYFFTNDSRIMSLDPNNGLTEVGFPVSDQFIKSPWSPSTAYATWHVGGTRDQALFVADGVGDWFRMCATPAPETGLTWSPKATIATGFKCVQSVETAPGVHQLLIGPSATGPILFRDWTTYADSEVAYPAYFTIGSLVLAHPGQYAELAFATFDSVRVGKALVPSVRIDEVEGPFEKMARSVPDPPLLVPSRTLFSNRHYFAQTNRPAVCRHLQLKVSWEIENQPSEILSSSIYGGYSQER